MRLSYHNLRTLTGAICRYKIGRNRVVVAHKEGFTMSEAVEQTTVVETPVDAGNESPVTPTEPVTTVETVVTPEKADNNGEAILKEVERREAKLKERYEQEYTTKAQQARDAVIAEQGHTWHGQPITTEAEYKQAVKDQKKYEDMQKQGYPTEAIDRLLAVEKSQEETTAKLTEYESKSKQAQDAQQFLEAYPDVKAEDIPASVWTDVDKGKSLVDAYARHENLTLKQQLAEATKAREIEALNAQNAASSTGSVTGQGSAPVTAFYTQSQVAEMSLAETNRNWSAIQQSMKNPKFYD